MSIHLWLLPALLSFLFWGLASYLPKLAVRSLPPQHMIIYHAFFSLLLALAVQGFYGFHPAFELRGVLIALAMGVTGEMGTLFFYFALRQGAVTPVNIVSALYPAVATVLAVVFLHEQPSAAHYAGLGLSLGAVVLMEHGERHATSPIPRRLWLPAACMAMMLWGVWNFLPKIALGTLAPPDVLFYEALGVFLVGIPFLVQARGRPVHDAAGIGAVFAVTIFSIGALLSCYYALQHGPVSAIVPLTALYPVIPALAARVTLKEKITRAQMGAIALAVLAVILLAS